ncbi:MAG TPA: N-acetylneuraminate synthase family protein [Anaerolineales bacterium]|nr:N-acetylneuraminate synthase family protein [Anaerolineales bacterium]
MNEIPIGDRLVGDVHPTYFVADISANHDGDLERAKALIHMCAEAGADAAKFQNFRAPKIVSDHGFRSLDGQLSHQATWKRSVFEVYQAASLPWDWTPILVDTCREAGIHYFSSPYDVEAVDMLDPHVPAHKIGSGDITWPEIIRHIASKGKPVLLATGASTIGEVQSAVHEILAINRELILMQCNTNYTASPDNFRHIHLRVLRTYAAMFPNVVLGLSDHTPGPTTVLGAVAFGARVVEKHFTDDNAREGPDHPFSMTPATWREMVDRTRELELALGSPDKTVADNERDTVVVQRRCVRAGRDLKSGEVLRRSDLDVLRPAPEGSILPHEIEATVGLKAAEDIPSGEALRWSMLVRP